MPQRRNDFIWFGPGQPSATVSRDLLGGDFLAAAHDRVAVAGTRNCGGGPIQQCRESGGRARSARASCADRRGVAVARDASIAAQRARGRERREPAANSAALRAGDAGAVAGDRDAGESTSRRRRRVAGVQQQLRVVPAMLDAERHREIDVRHHALVQEQRVDRQGLPRARRAGKPRASTRPCPRRASAVTPRRSAPVRRTCGAAARGPWRDSGEARKPGRCGSALRHSSRRGVVSRMRVDASRRRSRNCAANSQSSGPQPGEHRAPLRARGRRTSAAICAAPAVITPGSVQPGIGNGRSSAPVARMMRARREQLRARRRSEMPISTLARRRSRRSAPADELRAAASRARAPAPRRASSRAPSTRAVAAAGWRLSTGRSARPAPGCSSRSDGGEAGPRRQRAGRKARAGPAPIDLATS